MGKSKVIDTTDDVFEGWMDASDPEFFETADDKFDLVDSKSNKKAANIVEVDDDDEDDDDSATDLDNDDQDDDNKAKPKKKSDDVDVDKLLDFGEDQDEEEEDEEEDEDNPKSKLDKSTADKPNSLNLLTTLKERGLVDFELEEGEELTEERAEELLEDSYEKGIEGRISEMLQDLPPVTRDLLKFSLGGGSEADFLAKLGKSSATKITKDLDLDKEENQKLVVETNLRNDGYDDEYIKANIEFLADSGKLKAMSEKVHTKIVEKEEAERKADVERVTLSKAKQKENQRKFRKDITSLLSDNKDFNGLAVSTKDKLELPSYMTDTTVKTNSGGSVTAFQKDLFDALQDSKKATILAKLIREDFDFSSIENATKTKQAKNIKKDVRRTSSSSKTSGSSQKTRRKSLADLL